MSRELRSNAKGGPRSILNPEKTRGKHMGDFAFRLLALFVLTGTSFAGGAEPGPALQKSFVWIASVPPGKQVYAVFRKTIELADVPAKASLHLFADSRYMLWINGQYVERGPCRFDPIAPEYDTIDVRTFLRPGPNVLAVLVHHYADGKQTGPSDFCGRIMRHRPGLTARLDLVGPQEQPNSISTDNTWRTTTKTRFQPSPPSWAGIPDNINASLDEGDWTQPSFDDGKWEAAQPIEGGSWGPLRPRGIPRLRETRLTGLTVLEHSRSSGDGTAQWIWTPEKNYPNQKAPRWSAPEGVRFFRRTFDLPAGTKEVILHVTADNEFDCFFNGHKVGENHGDMSSWTHMRRIDATKHAVAGRNAIAIRAINKHYGDMSDPAGVLAVVSWKTDQAVGSLVSDKEWKGAAHPAEGWECLAYDDSTWAAVLALCPYGQGAWQKNIQHYPALREHIRNEPAPLSDVLPLDLTAGHELIVDAGVSEQAYSILDFNADADRRLELVYAQRFRDSGNTPAQFENQRCRYVARAGRQTYMGGDTFGFKYLVIRIQTGRIRLHDVAIVSRRYPFDCVGKFVCSDPALTKLWQICMHTVLVCSEDAYVDCATRERVEWMGDAYGDTYPATRVALAGPGDDGKPRLADPRLMRNMLRHIGQSCQPDGRLKAHHPSDRWDIHGYIEDYSCLWVNALRQYGDNTGDLDLARELWPSLTAQMKWFLDHRTERGLVKAREFIFPGNPLAYKTCEGASLNAYVYHALRDSAYLASRLGHEADAARYGEAAEALAKSVNTHLWDPTCGAYFGSITEGAKTPPTAHAVALCLYHDIVPAHRLEAARRWLLANHKKEGFAPYTHHFLWRELYRVDTDALDREVLDLMRTRWAPMIQGETGSVWESFGGGEYIHQMGAPPAYYLSAYVLGVRVDGPVSAKRILIEPRLGDLKEASGTVVTELGLVPISWKRSADGTSLEFSFEVPNEVTATVAIPRISNNSTLALNDKTLASDGKPTGPDTSIRGRFLVTQVGPGRYAGRIVGRR